MKWLYWLLDVLTSPRPDERARRLLRSYENALIDARIQVVYAKKNLEAIEAQVKWLRAQTTTEASAEVIPLRKEHRK